MVPVKSQWPLVDGGELDGGLLESLDESLDDGLEDDGLLDDSLVQMSQDQVKCETLPNSLVRTVVTFGIT